MKPAAIVVLLSLGCVLAGFFAVKDGRESGLIPLIAGACVLYVSAESLRRSVCRRSDNADRH